VEKWTLNQVQGDEKETIIFDIGFVFANNPIAKKSPAEARPFMCLVGFDPRR
jgi:hypothetical protein